MQYTTSPVSLAASTFQIDTTCITTYTSKRAHNNKFESLAVLSATEQHGLGSTVDIYFIFVLNFI